jgi:hypothetical protein
MKINIYIESGGNDYAVIEVFNGVYKKLLTLGLDDIEFNLIDSNTMHTERVSGGMKYGPYTMVIENDETKKYFLISYWDKIVDMIRHSKAAHWDMENCVEIFTSCGIQKDDQYYQPLNITYTPISFSVTKTINEDIINKLYYEKKEKLYPNILSFRGFAYGFRGFLIKDKRFNINPIKYNTDSEYFDELNKEYLNFAINGAAEISTRDIEILGLGNALFRTKLIVKLHNDLIPDYHYISVNIDDISIKQSILSYWGQLAERIVERFEEIKKDYDFIKFVGENGRKWYEENGTIDRNASIICEVLDFKKLYK